MFQLFQNCILWRDERARLGIHQMLDVMTETEISELHEWFRENKRDFPWRSEKTPYRVLVSEIMLQQTRASVVVEYFERWMKQFPTLKVLAEARLEEVIKAWEGLGYYSRARNLHKAAQQIVEEFGGNIPDKPELLAKVRGLGPYTIGALLSFGFQKKAAAIDGNVARVLSRYFLVEENIDRPPAKKRLKTLAEDSLDPKEPWVTSEAWIELGALVCTRKPKCDLCPLQQSCRGYLAGKALYLPIKSASQETTVLSRLVFLIEMQGEVLLKKGAPNALMADLYEFPYVENATHLKKPEGKKLPSVKHTFTRYVAHLHPYHLIFREKNQLSPFLQSYGITDVESYGWVHVKELLQLPFSSGHRKILRNWIEC